ncbi:hypothetical protein [Streptomyces sp. Root1310]|uniref:hypothetical protein n=1 Tax=Streptomyces sp. Root1310 TaxID=1736452 RepID=UPI000709EF0C|nr:hypothetical protein [Streptomyces sp. Root1310]KQX63429.1 hypothetical protein ASD48_26075 [Streptomyces sp. Root1310]
MPRIKMSAAEWTAKSGRAAALRYGRPDEAHRYLIAQKRAQADTLTSEAARLRQEAEEMEQTGPAE